MSGLVRLFVLVGLGYIISWTPMIDAVVACGQAVGGDPAKTCNSSDHENGIQCKTKYQ
jgi:hypothetical protein